MANQQKTDQAGLHQSKGSGEIERLSARVRELQAENARLSKALATAEQEREWYRKAIYEHEREKREFVDIDFDTLKATSCGLVEPIG